MGSVGAVSERGSCSTCMSSKGGCSVRQGLCRWPRDEDSCGERMSHQPSQHVHSFYNVPGTALYAICILSFSEAGAII